MDLRRTKHIDFTLLVAFFVINGLGLLTLFSFRFAKWNPMHSVFMKQCIWCCLGLVAATVLFAMDYRQLKEAGYLIHCVVFILLLATLLAGIHAKGARRWFSLFGFRFQPSELAKLSTIIALSCYFSGLEERRPGISHFFKSLPLVLPVFFVIAVQPDLGTAALVLAIYLCYIIFSGISWRFIVTLFLIFLAIIPVAWGFLKPYQRERVIFFFNPERDPLGKGYHLIQSKVAIGSGGFLGKGLKGSTQMGLGFIPEKHTDFIFSVFAEEWGFAGCMFLFSMYVLFLFRAYRVSQSAKDSFGSYLAFGIFSLFLIQIVVNTYMCVGLMPVVGIPLPLMSYGGSSILTCYMSLGILLSIYSRRFMF